MDHHSRPATRKRKLHDEPLPHGLLSTVHRENLDFDSQRVCCVTLATTDVYACLVCGKFYQGRGSSSCAFAHSIDSDHRVYINLDTKRVYVLPDNYELVHADLDDIRYQVDPRYVAADLAGLDAAPPTELTAVDGHKFHQGFLALSSLGKNDYANAILHIVAHVPPLRDWLLLGGVGAGTVAHAAFHTELSALVRRVWSPRALRAHVSPHDFMQHVSSLSKGLFTQTTQNDPLAFMTWLLNRITADLRRMSGAARAAPTAPTAPIPSCFQGKLQIHEQSVSSRGVASGEFTAKSIPFLFLSLDLPPVALFNNVLDPHAIPQVPLTRLLAKYNGVQVHELAESRRKYTLLSLPDYLVLVLKRSFSPSGTTIPGTTTPRTTTPGTTTPGTTIPVEPHNPTVVTFTPHLDMAPYCATDHQNGTENKYRLICNVFAEWPDKTRPRWKVHLLDKAAAQWSLIDDSKIAPVREELLFMKESYIQVWERTNSNAF